MKNRLHPRLFTLFLFFHPLLWFFRGKKMKRHTKIQPKSRNSFEKTLEEERFHAIPLGDEPYKPYKRAPSYQRAENTSFGPNGNNQTDASAQTHGNTSNDEESGNGSTEKDDLYSEDILEFERDVLEKLSLGQKVDNCYYDRLNFNKSKVIKICVCSADLDLKFELPFNSTTQDVLTWEYLSSYQYGLELLCEMLKIRNGEQTNLFKMADILQGISDKVHSRLIAHTLFFRVWFQQSRLTSTFNNLWNEQFPYVEAISVLLDIPTNRKNFVKLAPQVKSLVFYIISELTIFGRGDRKIKYHSAEHIDTTESFFSSLKTLWGNIWDISENNIASVLAKTKDGYSRVFVVLIFLIALKIKYWGKDDEFVNYIATLNVSIGNPSAGLDSDLRIVDYANKKITSMLMMYSAAFVIWNRVLKFEFDFDENTQDSDAVLFYSFEWMFKNAVAFVSQDTTNAGKYPYTMTEAKSLFVPESIFESMLSSSSTT